MAAGLCFAVMLLLYFMGDLSSFVPSSASASLGALIIAVAALAGAVRLLTRSTPAALAVAIVGEGGLLAGYVAAPDAFTGLFGRVMDGLSVFERFYTFADGVFDLSAALYFLTIIGVCLFLSVQSMEKRRWS